MLLQGTSTATFPAIGLLLNSSCAYGSAFAVGTNHIVTAAHMLYDPSKQVYTNPKYIDFGKVGKGNRGVAGGFNVKVKKCVVLDTWKNPNLSDADRAGYDIGACLVDTLPATVGFMDMVVPTYGSSTISTAGYPLEAPWPPGYTADTAIQKPFMTTETASITDSLISFNSQGSRGQSGSPFFAAQGAAGAPVRPASPSRPQAFGVLTQRPDSQTRTLGLPLTQQRINTIRGWMGNELSPS